LDQLESRMWASERPEDGMAEVIAGHPNSHIREENQLPYQGWELLDEDVQVAYLLEGNSPPGSQASGFQRQFNINSQAAQTSRRPSQSS